MFTGIPNGGSLCWMPSCHKISNPRTLQTPISHKYSKISQIGYFQRNTGPSYRGSSIMEIPVNCGNDKKFVESFHNMAWDPYGQGSQLADTARKN